MKTSKKIYVYKLTVDNGGAPCIHGGLLSLAICKPKIRSVANEGDLILGFGAKRYGERLLYVAEVTEKPKTGEYYRSKKYRQRHDCIYRDAHGNAQRKEDAKYHHKSDERRKDVGMHFEIAHVLLSRDFRYFGKEGKDEYMRNFPLLAKLVKKLKRGHRVNYSKPVSCALLELKNQVWRKYRRMKIGSPTDDDRTRVCNSDSPSAQCG